MVTRGNRPLSRGVLTCTICPFVLSRARGRSVLCPEKGLWFLVELRGEELHRRSGYVHTLPSSGSRPIQGAIRLEEPPEPRQLVVLSERVLFSPKEGIRDCCFCSQAIYQGELELC